MTTLLPDDAALASVFQEIQQLALQRHSQALDVPTTADPRAMAKGLTELKDELPTQGIGLQAATRHLMDEVLPTLAPGQALTRYFGFVTGGVLPMALVADWFVSLLDSNVQVHLPKETLSTLIEARTVGLLCHLLGLPRSRWTGTITTGATSSNVLGLACARERVLEQAMRARGHGERWSLAENGFDEGVPPVNAFVALPHASIKKAAALVGIGRARVVDVGQKAEEGLASVSCLDLDLDALKDRLATSCERKQGAIVVLGMGEVNTGALTAQMPALRELCDQYGAWLHIDAAFSAFVCLLDGFQWISQHLDMADSVTSDGHKQLNVPYDCGLFFVRKSGGLQREQSVLEDVLGPGRASSAPSYLMSSSQVSSRDEGEHQGDLDMQAKQDYLAHLPSPLFRNIENSRRISALPLYMVLVCHGREGFREIVDRNVKFARAIEEWMRSKSGADMYDVLTPLCQPAMSKKEDQPQPWCGPWATTVLLFAPSRRCPNPAFSDPSTGSARLIEAIKATRAVYVSPTTWSGRGAVRLAVSNWRTGLEGAKGGPREGRLVDRVEESEDYRVTVQTLRDVMARQEQ